MNKNVPAKSELWLEGKLKKIKDRTFWEISSSFIASADMSDLNLMKSRKTIIRKNHRVNSTQNPVVPILKTGLNSTFKFRPAVSRVCVWCGEYVLFLHHNFYCFKYFITFLS